LQRYEQKSCLQPVDVRDTCDEIVERTSIVVGANDVHSTWYAVATLAVSNWERVRAMFANAQVSPSVS
jgi:hypothetical protein